MARMWIPILILLGGWNVFASGETDQDDSPRKILGSSVVTSVSVIMNSENGTGATFSDAVGKPVPRPPITKLASPIELLNPDRYEFYTFDESGDLVKRLMTIQEIKAIIATSGDDAFDIDNFSDIIPEKRVNDIVTNVQNVLREEMESHKLPDTNQLFDTPDVSDSWSMILPAIFGNSGDDIKPERIATGSTPETIILQPTQTELTTKKMTPSSTTPKVSTFNDLYLQGVRTRRPQTTERPSTRTNLSTVQQTKAPTKIPSSTTSETRQSYTSTTQEPTTIKVQIFPNSNTNHLEEPFSKLSTSGTTIRDEHMSTRTPRPDLALESRISSLILEQTSPASFTIPEEKTSSVASTTKLITPKLTSADLSTSTPIPTIISTETTEDYKTSETKISTLSSKPQSPLLTSSTHGQYFSRSTTHKPITQQTEKIYILVRPLPPSSTSIAPETIGTSTKRTTNIRDKLTSTEKINVATMPSTTQAIYTISSQKPTIISVGSKTQTTIKPETISASTKRSSTSVRTVPTSQYKSSISVNTPSTSVNTPSPPVKTSSTSVKIPSTSVKTPSTLEITPSASSKYTTKWQNDDKPSYPGSSTLPITQFISYFTSSEVPHLSNTTLPTLAQILNNKIDLQPLTASSTEYPPFSTSQSVVSDVSSQRISTPSKDFGSIAADEPVFDDANSRISTTYSGNSNTFTKTESSISEEPTTEKEQADTVNINAATNKNILQNLLLSSTNVYEINSAINNAVTDSLEYTFRPEDLASTLSTQKTDDVAEGNQTLLESFSHLLSQAVNNVNGVILKDNITLPEESTLRASTDSKTPSEAFTNIFESTTDDFTETASFSTLKTDKGTYETDEPTTENVTPVFTTTESKHTDNLRDNITYLSLFAKRNASKPAKADLSLEMDYDLLNFNHTEMQKLVADKFGNPQIPNNLNSSPDTTTQEDVHQISTEPNTPLYFEESKDTTIDGFYTSTKFIETTEPEATDATQPTVTEPNIQTTQYVSGTVASTSQGSVSPLFDDKEQDSWTLVSTYAPHSKPSSIESRPTLAPFLEPTPTVDLSVQPMQGFGLEESTSNLEYDVYQFIQLCNELAFGFWKSVTTGISSARSVIVSPFAATSLLAMVFLGARGSTSGEMNEILKLDNMVTFNPHLIFKTITESIATGVDSGVATSAIVRQLYSDKSRESILNFYKERARFFYDGHVEEVSFKDIGDTIRRRTNLLVKKQTNGKLQEFLKDGSVRVRSPLAAVSASVMQTDCTKGSISDRDGELHFVVFPSLKQRRLIPIPAVVYRSGFLAGYEPSLDATAVALGGKDDTISYIFVLPGKQGINALGDGLSRLEKRLVESSFQKGAWSRLLRTLVPRPGLEVQIPRFSHRSIINATSALKQMGLKSLFDLNKADLRGLNGVAHDLYLSDMLQFNYFSVCGSTNTVNTHHSEYYPATSRRSLRKHRRLDHFEQQKILHDDPLFIIDYLSLPLNLRPRQARVPQVPRLRLDRPFLYFVRHNPTGLILHMGRFNPRLLP